MNTNEFEAWLSRNVRNVGKGGKKPSADPFNKALKGTERNKRAEEYPYGRIEEYHHYSERYSQKKSDDDQQSNSSRSNQSKSENNRSSNGSKTARNNPANLARNIISRVVAVAVSSVVVVSSYQTMQANAAAEKAEQVPVVATENWTWDEDWKAGKVKLLDSEGIYIAELPATVTVSQNDPTCTQEGAVIYTATAEDEDGKTYTDTKQQPIAPMGHTPGEWSDIILENGDPAKVSECTHCHEQFIISTPVVEE